MNEPDVTIAATGNGMKSHDTHDTFLRLSGGDGNGYPNGEVHLQMTSNDGEFCQGWFPLDVLLAELTQFGNNDD